MALHRWALTALAVLIAAAPNGVNEAGEAPAGWKLVWSDEFDGKELDRTKWDFDIGNGFYNYEAKQWINGWGNDELQYYTREPENAFVKDGMLHIRALKESLHGCGYTSARLKTRKKDGSPLFSRKYGRFEFRAKLPTGRGVWPALWMLPQDDKYGGWAASGEIDVLEARGQEPTKVLGTLVIEHKNAEGYWATHRIVFSIMGYNTAQVASEDAPKRFTDILAPKWSGRIVKGHPSYSGAVMTATFAMVRALPRDHRAAGSYAFAHDVVRQVVYAAIMLLATPVLMATSKPSYQAPAPVMIFGVHDADLMAFQIGPKAKLARTISRSGFSAFSVAMAADTSVAPGVICAVLVTAAAGASFFSCVSNWFSLSWLFGVLSVSTAIFLTSECLATHLASCSPFCGSEDEIPNMNGHLVTSVYSVRPWLTIIGILALLKMAACCGAAAGL